MYIETEQAAINPRTPETIQKHPSETLMKNNSWLTHIIDSTIKRYAIAPPTWHYEHGLVLKGILEAGLFRSNQRYVDFTEAWIDSFVEPDGSIRTYRLDDLNLDQINPGKLLFRPYTQSKEERYRKAILLLREQLKRQPRTMSNGFWHKKIYPYQMWLDGIYMAGPFYAQFGRDFDEPAAFDDVAHQVSLVDARTRNKDSGLLYHGWDESKQQKWADPLTGCSPHFWGRAMGWYLMAIIDILDFFPLNHPGRDTLAALFERTAQALLRVQDAKTGLWYQVLNLGESAENYLESSCSAMFIYAFGKAVRLRILEADYLAAAQRAYRGLLQKNVKMDVDGLLTLENTCGAAGLGGNPYRDGSYEYYVNEKIVVNDPKGVGAFILASLEIERATACE